MSILSGQQRATLESTGRKGTKEGNYSRKTAITEEFCSNHSSLVLIFEISNTNRTVQHRLELQQDWLQITVGHLFGIMVSGVEIRYVLEISNRLKWRLVHFRMNLFPLGEGAHPSWSGIQASF